MARRQTTLLCVDDNQSSLNICKIILEDFGYKVLTASSGRDGLEVFALNAVDAVILDYSMPGISGGEVARELRAENRVIPIILHTGYKELDDPLLENVTCTLPKGSLSLLLTKLNDLLHIPEMPPGDDEIATEPAPDSAHSAHVA